MYDRQRVLKANIDVGTRVAAVYREASPHYHPENVDRVRGVLRMLQKRTAGRRLLDIGCGTGFIIDIARELFAEVRGIDATPAMIERVDTASDTCDIRVEVARSEELPFPDGHFDVCTAHAVLHHLYDIRPTLKEAHRVLRPGGVFYSDLDPNRYFWQALKALPPGGSYPSIVTREIDAVLREDGELAGDVALSAEALRESEPLKYREGGFAEEDLRAICAETGFTAAEISYEWFLGEGAVIHDESLKSSAGAIRSHLARMLPLSRHLFKYVSLRAQK